jgi:S1-C subfamily serine protease
VARGEEAPPTNAKPAAKPTPGKKGAAGKPMTKPGAKKPAAGVPPAGAAPAPGAKSLKIPKLPKVSKTDEKYMPAIMNKLMKMRKQMAKIKGANWMKILEKHRDGVVQIMVVKKKFMWKAAYRAPLSEEISGSGWFIDNKEFGVDTKGDLLVVTNAHVAKNAAEINILVPSLGQEPIPAQVVGLCSQRDIALLRVKNVKKLMMLYKSKTGKDTIIKMKLGDSDEMSRGARVMAVGYPLGLKSVKASMGIVSGYQQFKSALYLQITAPINPGNSGGPLFNQNGQVVGINSAKIAKASGMSFSIASVQLKVMLDVLYQRRSFVVPYLGYSFSVGTKLIQNFLKVKGDKDKTGGIYITKVQPNGLFEKAGVKSGDLLLTVDGANIDRFGQTWMPTMKDNINILGLLARKKIGTQMVLGVWRHGENSMLSLRTKYDETPTFAVPYIYEPLLNKPKFQIFAGVVLMELSVNIIEVMLQTNVAELIKYMRPANRLQPAVIVAGVLPGSLASLDGSIKPGLIVQAINGQKIKKIGDVCSVLATPSKWYTITTMKTFSAFKAAQVKESSMDSAKLVGKNAQYCAAMASGSAAPTGSANIMGFIKHRQMLLNAKTLSLED